VLYAAYFLPIWQGAIQIGVVGLCYGIVLLRIGAGPPALTRWVVMVGTLAIAGTVTARLVRRLRVEVAGHEHAARERERLLELLHTAALTDELTGLPNRRARDRQLERELARAGRQVDSLCVAVLDLDNFKRFNDTHGHAGGDELLRSATAAWSTQLRATDLLARHGGEEFTLLLPECDERDALVLVERLRATTPAGQTVSAGLAAWDGEESADALLERADDALYAAKAGGRDRAVVASSAAAA
jgi:diguanylate cyclase (GGDEF)-like protein